MFSQMWNLEKKNDTNLCICKNRANCWLPEAEVEKKKKKSGDHDVCRLVERTSAGQMWTEVRCIACLSLLWFFVWIKSCVRWCGPGMTVVSACSSLPNCDGDSSTFGRPVMWVCSRSYFRRSCLQFIPLAFLSLSASKSPFQKIFLLKVAGVDSVRCN